MVEVGLWGKHRSGEKPEVHAVRFVTGGGHMEVDASGIGAVTLLRGARIPCGELAAGLAPRMVREQHSIIHRCASSPELLSCRGALS
jgi:hypothetical protein